MKHTELPWTCSKPLKGFNTESISVDKDEGANSKRMIFEISSNFLCCSELNEEDRANAKFIVKACNSHYELLEALQLTLKLLSGDPCKDVNEKPIDIIKRAVQNAETI
jgi:hypothetical protein